MTKNLLAAAGIGEDRLHVAWVSSAEAQRFVEVVTQVTESIRSQGQFDAGAFAMQLDAAEAALSGETLRWLVGKEAKTTTKGDVYGRPWDTASFESILDSVIVREYESQLILQAVVDGCTSPREIRGKIGLDLKQISYLLADMEKRSLVEFRGMEDHKPVFAAL